MALLFRRAECPDRERIVPFRSIEPEADYAVSFEDAPDKRTVRGHDLAGLKVEIPTAPGSAIVYYRRLSKP